MFEAITLYSFSGSESDELKFKANDKIIVTDTHEESGWWTGYRSNDVNKIVGLFPGNYVQLENSEQVESGSQNENQQTINNEIEKEQDQEQQQDQKQLPDIQKNLPNLPKRPINGHPNTKQQNQRTKNNTNQNFEKEEEEEEEEEEEKEKEKEKEKETIKIKKSQPKKENINQKRTRTKRTKSRTQTKKLSHQSEKIKSSTHSNAKPKPKRNNKYLYRIRTGFLWSKPTKSYLIRVNHSSSKSQSKKAMIKIQTKRGETTEQTNRSWSDFRWLHNRISVFYPNICIPPLLEIKPINKMGLENQRNVRMFSGKLFLSRVSAHPILSQSRAVTEFLKETDQKYFNKQKKNIETQRFSFWRTIKSNYSSIDNKYVEQIDKFRTNVNSHSEKMKELQFVFKDISLNRYREMSNSLKKLSTVLVDWSKIPFDWRKSFPERAKETNQSIAKMLKSIGIVWKHIADAYDKQSNYEYNKLIPFLMEYEQLTKSFQNVLKYRDNTQLEYNEILQNQLNLERKTTVTENDREKIFNARRRTSSSKRKADMFTAITLVELEYFRTMRAKDIKQIMKSYIKSQAKFSQYTLDLFQKCLKKIDSVEIIEGSNK
ncbi:sorting nexin [Anaeramoeba flamelloides]|uniref:Sorting nexin n=1 Tax=Anaeramoeba flamelloides TaxID=1746091 RepID=A0AAV7ZX89_9EUKA|nr:sorting nexin [Anaeramoeba flamelloides]